MKVFLGLINDTPKEVELSLSLLNDKPACCLIRGLHLSAFSVDQEDGNAEMSKSIFIWHGSSRQLLTEWRGTWHDRGSMRE